MLVCVIWLLYPKYRKYMHVVWYLGLVVGHMMGMELVEFPSTTIGQGVLSMVITCVRRTMGKEL